MNGVFLFKSRVASRRKWKVRHISFVISLIKLTFFYVFIAICFTGCNFSSDEIVVITIEDCFQDSRINDCYFMSCDEQLNPKIERIDNFVDYSIKIDKRYLCPFLVYELNQGKIVSPPYGCIYPYSSVMTKKDSFASYILYNLCIGSTDMDKEAVKRYLLSFNWELFMEYIDEVEDPWLLDEELIISKIAQGTFRKSDIKYK